MAAISDQLTGFPECSTTLTLRLIANADSSHTIVLHLREEIIVLDLRPPPPNNRPGRVVSWGRRGRSLHYWDLWVTQGKSSNGQPRL